MSESLHVSQPVAQSSTACIQEGQVCIRPLGEIPAFLHSAQQALVRGDRDDLERQMPPGPLEDFRHRWSQAPARIDQAWMMVRLLQTLGRYEEALGWCQQIEGVESSGLLYWQMAQLLESCPERLSEACHMAGRAVDAEPENRFFLRHLARLECQAGRLEQGLQRWEGLLQTHPDDADALFNWLWFKQYSPHSSRALFAEGFRRLSRTMPAVTALPPVVGHADPDRSLNIGFISPDFHHSAAAVSLEAVLDGLSGRSLSLYAYSKAKRQDQLTQRLRTKFQAYHEVDGWSPERIAALIRQDRIDILIEVGGYVRDHGLDVFRYRPAPIQMDYHGIATTGLPEVDYRVTDRYLDGPDDLACYTEQSVMLHGCHCFCPPHVSPLIGPLPALSTGQVTFGSFSNHIKITEPVIRLWCRILKAVPGSRMVIKFIRSMDLGLRRAIHDQFVAQGVVPDRVQMLDPAATYAAHMDLYNQVDLCLDTFPFNGCITTFESLWMGVPVLTRTGDTFVSRVGLSMLSHLDLAIFCAHSDREYVEKAVAFAGQLDSLAALRQGLRPRLLQSPLCNPQRLGDELEQAFRAMWRQWCQEQ